MLECSPRDRRRNSRGALRFEHLLATQRKNTERHAKRGNRSPRGGLAALPSIRHSVAVAGHHFLRRARTIAAMSEGEPIEQIRLPVPRCEMQDAVATVTM